MNTKETKKSSSRKNWFVLAGCALVAASVGLYFWNEYHSARALHVVAASPNGDELHRVQQPQVGHSSERLMDVQQTASTLDDFWLAAGATIPSGFTFDPQVMYDADSDRSRKASCL